MRKSSWFFAMAFFIMSASQVLAQLAPNASFTYNNQGHWVNFDASGSYDPDGSIVSYSWDFDDGTTFSGTSPWVDHYYYASGWYWVTLTVTDNSGFVDDLSFYVSVCVPGSPTSPWEPEPLCPF